MRAFRVAVAVVAGAVVVAGAGLLAARLAGSGMEPAAAISNPAGAAVPLAAFLGADEVGATPDEVRSPQSPLDVLARFDCDVPDPQGPPDPSAVRTLRWHAPVPGRKEPTGIAEYIGWHRDVKNAVAYMQWLRTAAPCGARHKPAASVIGSDFAGAESLLVRVRHTIAEKTPPNTLIIDQYLSVVRVDASVTVVADFGWVDASGDEALVRRLAVAAAERVRVLGPLGPSVTPEIIPT